MASFALDGWEERSTSGAVNLAFAPLERCVGPSLSIEEIVTVILNPCSCISGGVTPVCPSCLARHIALHAELKSVDIYQMKRLEQGKPFHQRIPRSKPGWDTSLTGSLPGPVGR
jgi:hypothetical protein